jgi:putative ABC transport system substrate-binding protein
MRRRAVVVALGSSVLGWALTVRAQQNERVRRIGFLLGATEENDAESHARVAAFRQGLESLGWIEGRNIRIDYRFAGGDADRIHAYVSDLVNSAPDLIVANTSPVLAVLKQMTSTIPIVFAVVNDPVGQGLVASLARPGGNITGFTLLEFEVVGKWMELLKEIAPQVKRATLLFNPVTAPYYANWLRQLIATSNKLATELTSAPVQNMAEVETALAAVAGDPGGGLIIAADPFMVANRGPIAGLVEHYRLPSIAAARLYPVEGALMSYGPDTADIFRRSAAYVDRILKGEKPADLPVQAPDKFEFVINLKTAKALGLDVPATLLAQAHEVIE